MKIIPNTELLKLSGKTAIVTGGSLGIGFAISNRLAEAGANVVVASRNLEESEQAVKEIADKGYIAFAVKADVTQEEDIKNLINKTIEKFGKIDILVNNAGIYPFMLLKDMTTEIFDKVIATNLRGVFLCIKNVSDQMIKQNIGGKIINITSIDALHPSMEGLAHYDASKHGVWGFTKNVALELAKYNIQVNAVAPGGVLTQGVANMQGQKNKIDRNPEPTPADVPLKRIGVPDDIAKVVLFLASEMSSYITGSQIVVDGGTLLK